MNKNSNEIAIQTITVQVKSNNKTRENTENVCDFNMPNKNKDKNKENNENKNKKKAFITYSLLTFSSPCFNISLYASPSPFPSFISPQISVVG